ncbi:hypothetical protein PISMIDRAFT_678534 [Pisolithus microcarpus 441]|uniref:Heterokaryon incompatibility domain-containing protein n=1 Tax=Pisolithus microcarpus 441 TaxID=765257 RepID=A0A0C9ZDQ9_9AGAM|nr:hypothetical protein PISMIDRAFT_678534 [Pisolithus microcarpus 441]
MAFSDGPSGVTKFDIKQGIRIVAFVTLETMPTRLLHTHTGILCNRDAQILNFMGSERCERLESANRATRSGINKIEHIRTEILGHFQYAMLSHRWGEGEPSLCDIEGRNVYNMLSTGALGKPRAFRVVALGRDHSWAWSNTCCIDKHSSNEVQETILSMFVWYRQSLLTVTYLSDVADAGSLSGIAKWFRRGWTLQELLAPPSQRGRAAFGDKSGALNVIRCTAKPIWLTLYVAPQFLSHSLALLGVTHRIPAVPLRTPASCRPSDVCAVPTHLLVHLFHDFSLSTLYCHVLSITLQWSSCKGQIH